MEDEQEYEKLKLAIIESRSLTGLLKTEGIGCLIWGAINCVIGAWCMSYNSMNVVACFLGVFLIVSGVVIIHNLKPWGLILNGIGFFGVGAWNIGVSLVTFSHPNGEINAFIFISLGLFQIAWGVRSFILFKDRDL